MKHTLLALLLILSVVASACGNNGGAPSAPGQYPVQAGSVHFDGDRYQLYWADNAQNGTLHRMETRNLKMVRDPNGTFLDVPQGGGDPTLHLREDEPITVDGRDNQGAFSSPWFPFLLGATLGNVFGGGRGGQTVIINNPAPGETRTYDAGTPAYRYPPTGTFGRDDELHGSLDTSKPQAPDYNKVQPAPYATTGKSAGTGGGSAASNKSVGTGASNATTGQVGGTGAGTAASSKGGFANGGQSYASSGSGGSGVGAGSNGSLGSGSSSSSSGSGSSKPSIGSGSSSSKGVGGARAPSVGGRR